MKKPKIDSVWKTNTLKTGNRYQVMQVYQVKGKWRVGFMLMGDGTRGDQSLEVFNDCFNKVEES